MAQNAWLFDIDGVLTDLLNRNISEKLIKIVARLNKSKQPVTFITGRSYAWLAQRVLNLLQKEADIDLSLIFCSCEKGGVSVTFDSNGKTTLKIVESLKVPNFVQKEVEDLVSARFSKTMFYDPKLTMATAEAREDVANSSFIEEQKELDKELQEMIAGHNLQKSLKIYSAPIATDVESANVTKAIGTKQFLIWLKKKSIHPKKIYAFGDRLADIEMARFLYAQNQRVTFIFTGDKSQLDDLNFPFKFIVPKKLHTSGTLEYLKQIGLV